MQRRNPATGGGPADKRRRRTRSSPRDQERRGTEYPVVGIGASAGGLEAVSRLLRHLPGDLGMAFVVVQHLDPDHESSLPELLARVCPMPVRAATEAMPLEADHVFVIPPNAGMILSNGSLHLMPRDETRDPRKPIDLFQRSLAEELRGRSIGVVLSGTGNDGTAGLEAIRAEGGITFAQDATATYDGMPSSAATAGCVDYLLPPEGIAKELARISRHPSVSGALPDKSVPPRADEAGGAFDGVVRRLSEISGVDYSNYKQATIRRRIHRRMVIRGAERVEDYREILERDSAEAEALGRDVLINVTHFFRDASVFDALRRTVFPALLTDRTADRPIRIWVPGCATGEEVYSLAICLLEALGPRSEATPIKLFGTDVSESVIRLARSGRFPERIAADVGPGRLRRFFVKDEGGYAIAKAVRDLCIFARQDATRDPPFSNLDLISCRNVLIYLGPVLQKRILPFFHYALREGGFLLLGASETVGPLTDLFSEVDRKQRIYARRSVPTRLVFDVAGSPSGPAKGGHGATSFVPAVHEVDLLREADRVVLSRCAPPGVLIDERLEILQFRGDTGLFLTPAPGAPSNNLRSMAREGLFPDFAEALEEGKAQNAPVRREGLHIRSEGRAIHANIELIPILTPVSSRRCFLVLFQEVSPTGDAAARARRPVENESEPAAERHRIVQLERELASTKDYLRASVEEREAGNEELRAANEELLSGNEELQSTNEELQTAHEELQATNEELLTVNEELQQRNEEATLLSNDLTNLLTSVEIPIVMLGRDLHIRRFTPSAGKLLNLIPSDLNRSILDFKPKIDVTDLESLLGEVLDTFAVVRRDVRDEEGRWHSLCVRPYRSQDNRIDGVVLTLSDIDEIKRSAERLESARDFAESIIGTVRESLLVLDHELRVKQANRAFREVFRTVPSGIGVPQGGKSEDAQWRVPGLHERLRDIVAGGGSFEDFEVDAELPEVGQRILRMSARQIRGRGAEQPLVLLAIADVTQLRRNEKQSALLTKKLQEAQRVKSLGVLAGGIAHDFNNILTAILGYASLVQAELQPGSRMHDHVANIEQSSLRAADLCRQMLAYSGKGRLVTMRLDLSAVITEFRSLLQASVSKKSALAFELAEGLPAVVGDVAQLHQVVMNLVINASEALGDEGGTITVRTGRMRPDPAYFASARTVPDRAQQDYAYIEIADDGCGMDAETQERIFDPYFSRKFEGRGLGLAAVIGIVRGHHGALTLDSEPGRGSTFRILLPEVDGPAEEMTTSPAADLAWRGEGTVLVVDDEKSVRRLLTAMLERLGFRVLEAADGRAGVELFREMASEIDLVMLDLTMPELDGAAAFRELRQLRPDARVVLMSGYDRRPSMDAVAEPGLAGFLRKPFGLNNIVSTLRQVFEGE